MRELLTPRQVAQAIGVSEASLKRWCDKGMLPAIRTAGGHRRLPVGGVIEFLRRTGHVLVRPEILGLPRVAAAGQATIGRLTPELTTALEAGDEERARQILLDLYLAGNPARDICDASISPVFVTLGQSWQHGDLEVYQERRACEICMRVLFEVSSLLPPLDAGAPYAIGGTLDGDPYTLPTTMAEVCLREGGWRAESHGCGNPAATLCAAIREKRPRLFWLSVSCFDAEAGFLEQYERIYETAAGCGVALVVGGRALTERVRRRMTYSAHCDNMRHLVAFARTLEPRLPGTPSPEHASPAEGEPG